MNILHVTLGFYPAQTWGGPVKSVNRISKELIKRGHQVTIYCTNLLNKKHKIQTGTFERNFNGIRVVYFNTWNLPWWPGTLGPIWLPDLNACLKREMRSFDVVHVHGYRSPIIPPIVRAAKQENIPIVTQPRGTLSIVVNSILVKHIYDCLIGRLEIKNISALIALQESERQQALAHGIPGERIEIIPNGIDLRDRDLLPEKGSFRRKYSLAPNRRVILFLGRINKKKGVDMLIEAFDRLKRMNAQLVIAGPDDGHLSEVQKLIKKYNLRDNVKFLGLLSGTDVLSAFQDADLFVLPCRNDTFPNTIMESCLVGTPMVITDRCEIAHLVKDRVAKVVPFDAQAFADAMELMLTDRRLYDNYRSNCSTVVVDTFSLQHEVDCIEAVYHRVIAEKAEC